MIRIKIDTEEAKAYIKSALGYIGEELTPKILRNAINETAQELHVELVDFVNETYAVQEGEGKKDLKMLKLRKATIRKLTATLSATGRPNNLALFNKDPRGPELNNKIPYYRANVLRKNHPKRIFGKTDNKGFLTRFQNGHLSFVSRETAKRLPIKALYSVSTPQMLSNDREFWNKNKQKILELLLSNVEKYLGSESDRMNRKYIRLSKRINRVLKNRTQS